MAKEREIPVNVKMNVDAKDANESIEEFGERVGKLRDSNKKTAKQASKDWTGFADLFSGLLPRNLQMMIRRFKSTRRAVGRLSKSFKILKSAFAGLGIGLLLLALETLISRWDDITRLLSGVTDEQERYNKVVKASSEALDDYNTRNAEYIRIVQDTTSTTADRTQALDTLASSMREVKDLDIESADGLDRFNKAVERQIELVTIQAQEQELLNQINELRNEKNEVELSWYDYLANKKDRQAKLDSKKAEKDDVINGLLEQYNQLQRDRLKVEQETTEELNRQREEAEKAAEAERERQRLAAEAQRERERLEQQAIKNAEYREEVMQTLERDELLRSLNARDRARKELELEREEAKQKLQDANATHEELEALAVYYDNRKKELERGFAEEDAALRAEADEKFGEKEEDQFLARQAKLTDEYEQLRIKYADHKDVLLQLDQWYASEKQKIDDDAADHELKTRLANLDAEAGARNAKLRAAEDIASQLMRLSEEGSNAQKAFAVTQVLLSQAQAVSSAIASAVKAAANTGPAAPVVTPLLIAQMVGIALSSFAQVRSILQQAGADAPSAVQRGGGGGGQTQALVPQGVGGRQQQVPQVNQSYVVQSQLQGMMHLQSGLEKRLHL